MTRRNPLSTALGRMGERDVVLLMLSLGAGADRFSYNMFQQALEFRISHHFLTP